MTRFALSLVIAMTVLSIKGFKNITFMPLGVYLLLTIGLGSFLLIAYKFGVLPGPTGALRKEQTPLFYYAGITLLLSLLMIVNVYFLVSLVH
ncbi:MAG: hypothetical protein GYB58_15305 [Gammaproteobacteria bacterium]|nr:hypothetical protein [Gammaproteobacteria bacterium]